jgi:hypothetical protein
VESYIDHQIELYKIRVKYTEGYDKAINSLYLTIWLKLKQAGGECDYVRDEVVPR